MLKRQNKSFEIKENLITADAIKPKLRLPREITAISSSHQNGVVDETPRYLLSAPTNHEHN